MNNLDPEVAERPDDLVVYGGTGQAARAWDAVRRDRRDAARRSSDDETLLVQSGKPVGVFRTHEWAPRVLIANSILVPEWATWDEFRRLEAAGLTMYGQMTAGSWIYIGTQGILQGTYECFAAIANRRFGGTPRRDGHADRRARRHGRRAAAGGHDERRRRARASRSTRTASSSGIEIALPRRWSRRPRRGASPAPSAKARRAAPLSIGAARQRRRRFPELLRRGVRARHRHRPDAAPTIRSTATSRPGSSRPTRRGARTTRPGRLRRARARESMRRTARRWSASSTAARRCSTTATTCAREAQLGGFERAFDYPGLRARLHPPAVLRGQGPVPLGGAVRRPGRHRRHRPRRARASSRDNERAARAGSRLAEREDRLPGAAGAHLLARLRRARTARPALQRAGRERRAAGADRDRPRPPRLGLGRLAVPRDRGHEGRLRRDRRLAAPQRAGQHQRRRDLGLASTTAAASASAARSTPGWWSWPTAPSSPGRSSSACSRPTPARA